MGGKRGKSQPITVGHRYYWDVQSGLGRGPVDEIVEIRVDDKSAYVGKPGELTRSQAIYIDKPNLFGGEETGGEGGIQGRMEIMMGEPDQKPTPALINLLKGVHNPAPGSAVNAFYDTTQPLIIFHDDPPPNMPIGDKDGTFFANGSLKEGELAPDDKIPGFRGIVTTLFSGLISCYNAYPKKHNYRVRRALKGWRDNAPWYPEKCRILLRNDNLKISGLSAEQEENVRQIHAMNPAHILVECATNKSWGGKKEITDLDLDSYKQAADRLFDEGFGICIRYNRQSSIKQFIQQIVDHIGAVQYDNVETGKQALRLIRQDYNPDSLPTYHYDNGILRVQDDDNAATDNAANQIIVKFFDPVAKKEEQAIANNIAAIQMHGVISKTVEYRGVPTFDLAARLAQRDLEMTASGLMRLKIVFDMRGSQIKPGDVFKVHLPERDIQSAVFRATRLENGNEGEIVVTCMQDVFGLPAANYSTKQTESLYVPPDYSAKPILHHRTFEVPYHVYSMVLSASELAFVKPTDCYLRSLAELPSPLTTNFVMQVDSGAGFGGRALGTFSPSVVISEAVTKYQTRMRFSPDSNTAGLIVGQPLMIDDEIVKIEAVDINNAILTVGRGCADTVPQAHPINSRAWSYLLGGAVDTTKYTVNEQLKVRLIPRTTQATLDPSLASVETVTTVQRQARPYPPGKVQVDGTYTDKINDGTAFKLTWAHRDRDIQADNLIPHTDDSTVLGDGVSYKVALMDGNHIVRDITTTGTEFIYPDAQKVDGEQFNKVVLSSVKNGLSSLFHYQFSVGGEHDIVVRI